MKPFDIKKFLTENKLTKLTSEVDTPTNEEEVEEIQHDCANHVLHEKYGHGICLEEQHTLLEDGTVTHYDVFFKEGSKTVKNIPVNELQIINSSNHGHKKRKANEAHCNEQMMRVDEAHCNEIYHKLQERYGDSGMEFKMEGKDIIVASHCNEGQMNQIVEELVKEGYTVHESHCNE